MISIIRDMIVKKNRHYYTRQPRQVRRGGERGGKRGEGRGRDTGREFLPAWPRGRT